MRCRCPPRAWDTNARTGNTYDAMATQFNPVMAMIAAPFNSKMDCRERSSEGYSVDQQPRRHARAGTAWQDAWWKGAGGERQQQLSMWRGR